jgi:hypothetical protein
VKSKLEAEAKERKREAGKHYGERHPKEQEVTQLIEEALDDKNVREATHHLARVFSTNRQYVCDAGKGRALETFRAKAYWVPKFVQ